MASLYEIDQAMLQCLDLETGEVIDPEMLNSLQMEREAKIENVALWVKNLQSDIAAFDAEVAAFEKRKEQSTKKIESLKRWLAMACGGEKFSSTKCVVSFRRSEKVEITDKTVVPEEYLTETVTINPNKTAIKEAIKAGKQVEGCALVENINAQIK